MFLGIISCKGVSYNYKILALLYIRNRYVIKTCGCQWNYIYCAQASFYTVHSCAYFQESFSFSANIVNAFLDVPVFFQTLRQCIDTGGTVSMVGGMAELLRFAPCVAHYQCMFSNHRRKHILILRV